MAIDDTRLPFLRSLALPLACLVSATALAAAPAPADLAALRGHARTLSYSSDLVTLQDGTKWIRTEVLVEAVFDGSLDQVAAILGDHESYPKVFSRIAEVKVVSRKDGQTVVDQRNLVAVMGVKYETRLRFLSEAFPKGPGKLLWTFRMTETDGSTRQSEGSWELEETRLDSGPAVYLRYHCLLLVEPRYPLQLQVMKRFGAADFEKTVEELGAALARQGPGHSFLPPAGPAARRAG